jgi:hypothetical protein
MKSKPESGLEREAPAIRMAEPSFQSDPDFESLSQMGANNENQNTC